MNPAPPRGPVDGKAETDSALPPAGPPDRKDPATDALALAAQGLHVFPCRNKKPLTPRGFKDATTDPQIIRALWKQYPDAQIGVATGAVSGLVVIDLDRKNGVDGLASLKALGKPTPTVMSRTPSGGVHLFYHHPGGHIPSSAGKLGPGIDVRADGGYVIVPPSPGYEWIGGEQ